jgi:hypothetical protein
MESPDLAGVLKHVSTAMAKLEVRLENGADWVRPGQNHPAHVDQPALHDSLILNHPDGIIIHIEVPGMTHEMREQFQRAAEAKALARSDNHNGKTIDGVPYRIEVYDPSPGVEWPESHKDAHRATEGRNTEQQASHGTHNQAASAPGQTSHAPSGTSQPPATQSPPASSGGETSRVGTTQEGSKAGDSSKVQHGDGPRIDPSKAPDGHSAWKDPSAAPDTNAKSIDSDAGTHGGGTSGHPGAAHGHSGSTDGAAQKTPTETGKVDHNGQIDTHVNAQGSQPQDTHQGQKIDSNQATQGAGHDKDNSGGATTNHGEATNVHVTATELANMTDHA